MNDFYDDGWSVTYRPTPRVRTNVYLVNGNKATTDEVNTALKLGLIEAVRIDTSSLSTTHVYQTKNI